MKNLLQNLKENNQDHEFYPTTQKIIAKIVDRVDFRNFKHKTILDIGAGNGNFFTKLENEINKKMLDKDENFYFEKFAIEKSEILVEQMPNDIVIIGADFHQQTLIDKDFDYIFCNPPYSEFKDWMHKIIKEANSNDIIMIVPSRWAEDNNLLNLIAKRQFQYKIIGNDDFLDGERQARAYVDIIHFSRIRSKKVYFHKKDIQQSFIDFFEDEFGFEDKLEKKLEEKLQDATENELIAGNNTVETLCNLYNVEFTKLLDSYKAITKLGGATLKDIGLDKIKILSSLEYKISNLKKEYWQYLINNTDKITSRLIKHTREKLIEKITVSIGSVDFNEKNIYNIIIWIIKNANKSYDEQLLYMFDICIDPANVKNYKSNQKVFETEKNRWGTGAGTVFKNKKEIRNITLDYRIITTANSYGYRYYSYNNKGLGESIIQDWAVICNNLLGHTNFGEIKFYKNGNCHIKFNVDFAKAFNIQASLLKGWIKDKKQAKEDFAMDIKEEDLNYNHFRINKNNFLLLN